MRQFSEFIIRNRLILLILLAAITGFFAYHITDLKVRTEFDDLLPANHPYVSLHKSVRSVFGGANKVTIVVKAKEGDIFNTETLSKIQRLTRAAQLLPSVNNYQILSLASRKVKDIRAIPGGMQVGSIMFPDAPQTEAGLQALKRNVAGNDFIYGSLVSLDFKAASLSIDFLEKDLNYKEIFDAIKAMVDAERDAKHTIHMIGTPVLYGWVYQSFPEILKIFLLTGVVVIVLLLFFARGNIRGVLLPMVSAFVCGIWGVGLYGMLGYAIDPLLFVIPFLISADAIRHGFQVTMRFIEEQARTGKRKEAAVMTIQSLLLPASVSLITDVMGAFFLIFSPMPLLEKLSIVASFWIFSILIGVLVLGPILLSYFPVSEKAIQRYRSKVENPGFINRIFDRIMLVFARLPRHKNASLAVIVTLVAILAATMFLGSKVEIGDIRPGSPILWQDSVYNRDFAEVNKSFRASEPLTVIVKGAAPDVIKQPQVVHTMEAFQRYMETDPSVGYSVSAVDIARRINMVLYGDNPKREFIPNTWDEIGYLYFNYISQGEPGDFQRFGSTNYQDASIQIQCLDHKGDTIRRLLAKAKRFIADHPMEQAELKLAAGLLGILGAANEEIAVAQLVTVILAFTFVFFFSWISFRSVFAAVLLLTPLLFSNFLTFSFMYINKIGLNVNTLPVACLGVGLGIDYGIYIVSRIREEYARIGDVEKSVESALMTSGRSVLATAITIVMSVALWAWAPLRFLAEMGILLAFWMGVVALVALIILPIAIVWFKPAFITKKVAARQWVHRKTNDGKGFGLAN
ncbi:MAG: MMPL family transporter [Desulfatitalea sp.]|nr:MMPL family transporter [Desulfatitalea sp.]NNJ99095.1 MMPL family transporter [Desulfatitalea sp.]